MIGDVVGEIGVAAIRLQQRPVDVVAELRGAEQGLLAILPILVLLALGRRQPALIDQVAGAQIRDGRADLVGSAIDRLQRALGKEHLVDDAERRQIVADHRHHAVDRRGAHQRQPFGLRLGQQRVAMLGASAWPTETR